ncbi:hypothetical protein ABK040_012439 [Willaertia magna]
MTSLFKGYSTNATEEIKFPETQSKKDPTATMRALQWEGKQNVTVNTVPKPMVTEPKDAIVRISTTTICGSDLHLYFGEFGGMKKGDIIGHECVGYVESVGSEVRNIKVGDRVVVSAVISCGECEYCKKGLMSCCDRTNPSKEMEALYGHRTGALFGYSHLTGGYEGCQADYVRVPIADVNLLPVANDKLTDEQLIVLADIACTGWHANELACVDAGDVVCIWGAGPVGLMACMWAIYRGASRVIIIDGEEYRLQLAKNQFVDKLDTINFHNVDDVVKEIQRICPNGPDKCIEAVGFRFQRGILHTIERALYLETDQPQTLNECILACKKGGRIGIVGDYLAFCNHFNIGAFMEKSLGMAGGQVLVQKYWKHLLQIIESGQVDPTFCMTHKMSFDEAAKAYKMFANYEDGAVKIILKTGATAL